MNAGGKTINGQPGAEGESQRIDKWLWCARIFKTRSLATKFTASGQMRLTRNDNTVRIDKASALVKPGDELAFSIGERIFVLKILACAVRRGPASEARELYDDLSPPKPPKPEKPPAGFSREKGEGRPTKKDRRALDALKSSR